MKDAYRASIIPFNYTAMALHTRLALVTWSWQDHMIPHSTMEDKVAVIRGYAPRTSHRQCGRLLLLYMTEARYVFFLFRWSCFIAVRISKSRYHWFFRWMEFFGCCWYLKSSYRAKPPIRSHEGQSRGFLHGHLSRCCRQPQREIEYCCWVTGSEHFPFYGITNLPTLHRSNGWSIP